MSNSRKAAAPAKKKARTGRPPKGQEANWAEIERNYRLGLLPDAQLAKAFGISPTTLCKRAKAEGWTRHLSEAVRATTQQKLLEQDKAKIKANSPDPQADADAVNAAADVCVSVINEHRTDIRRARELGNKLLAEVERIMDEIDQVIAEEVKAREEARREQEDRIAAGQKLRKGETLVRPLSLAERVSMRGRMAALAADVYRKTSPAVAKYIELERQAYNIDDAPTTGDLAELLSALNGKASSNPMVRLRTAHPV